MSSMKVLINNKDELKVLIDNKVLLSDHGYFTINKNRFPTIFTLYHTNLPGYQSHSPLSEYKKEPKNVKTLEQYLKSKHCQELIEIMKEPYLGHDGIPFIYDEIKYEDDDNSLDFER